MAEMIETFERFMDRCLHDPERGYYAKHIRSIGVRGDFTTAPQLSDAPAKAIAAWAADAMRRNRIRHLIEIGPGLGTLAKSVLENLPFTRRLRTRLHLVDSSPALAVRQKKLLGNTARYHSTIHQALAAAGGRAIIYSNELVDAFAVRLFQKSESSWREIGLEHSDNSIREILLPAATLPPSTAFSAPFASGQRVEVHDSYRIWLEGWLPLWKSGEILTIDYGSSIDTLYHRRPLGTLRAYLLQQRLHGAEILQNPGLQDITADVNFSDLIGWHSQHLSSHPLCKLSEFIRPYRQAGDEQLVRAAESFLVLHQVKFANLIRDAGQEIRDQSSEAGYE